jgi:hypothetical protein
MAHPDDGCSNQLFEILADWNDVLSRLPAYQDEQDDEDDPDDEEPEEPAPKRRTFPKVGGPS